MSRKRVALIFDDTSRPETTGVYCRRALQQLAEVEHFLPSQMERIPRQGIDLYLQIDDGLESRLPAELHPCAWWAIDTHLNFSWCLTKARDFDFVFAAQRDGAEQLRRQGIASATWLPLACDPDIHCKHDVARSIDLCFVGNVFPGEREKLLHLLQRNFPSTFVGQRYFEEMARTYSATRIVFNRSVRNDVNMRVFEAVACGSLLLTNDLSENGQAELFKDGVHLATYRDPEELLDKVRFHLARPDTRERIAAAGREEALARHTYRHRMEKILETVTQSPPPVAPGPSSQTVRHSLTDSTGVGPAVPDSSQDPRDSSYFEHARPELLALVPQGARKVLEIGCGGGRLGESLKARQPVEVVGIECDERSAAAARTRLDQVLVGDVEKMEPGFAPHSFDVVLCGDVLEHLREPGRLLRRAREWLRPDGRVIASIPNVRHHSVIRSLLAGNWTYESAGLLDRTHLRFFTRRSIEELFQQAGFRVRRLGVVPGPGYDEWVQQGQPGTVRIGRLSIEGLPREEAEEFYVYQYLVTAEPANLEKPLAAAFQHLDSPASMPPRQAPQTPVRLRGPMRFTQDFIKDFEQINFFGPPFALVRYGDGERAICMGLPIAARDGWAYQEPPPRSPMT